MWLLMNLIVLEENERVRRGHPVTGCQQGTGHWGGGDSKEGLTAKPGRTDIKARPWVRAKPGLRIWTVKIVETKVEVTARPG